MKYPSDWVTTGFSRVDGKWVELGHSLSVTVDPPAIEPEIPIHEVAALLDVHESLVTNIEKMEAERIARLGPVEVRGRPARRI